VIEINPIMQATAIPIGDSGPWRIEKQDSSRGVETLLLHGRGTCWMTDSDFDLEPQQEFVDLAAGSVLVTGLGLGCVIRGLLAKQDVTHITVIENDEDVIALVWPYMARRVRLMRANALTAAGRVGRFDCAWHDVWLNQDSDSGPLLEAWAPYVGVQKAWPDGRKDSDRLKDDRWRR